MDRWLTRWWWRGGGRRNSGGWGQPGDRRASETGSLIEAHRCFCIAILLFEAWCGDSNRPFLLPLQVYSFLHSRAPPSYPTVAPSSPAAFAPPQIFFRPTPLTPPVAHAVPSFSSARLKDTITRHTTGEGLSQRPLRLRSPFTRGWASRYIRGQRRTPAGVPSICGSLNTDLAQTLPLLVCSMPGAASVGLALLLETLSSRNRRGCPRRLGWERWDRHV